MEDSTMKTQPAGISSQCRRTDRLLWEAYARSECGSADTDRCRLLFPRYREKEEGEKEQGGKRDLRVSEQGARFAFVEALCTAGQFRYSVETPTDKTYQFTGETKEISAQTDLTVYDLQTRCRRCNVEFKAGGISPSAQERNKQKIYKDVEKLMRERVWGLWFHLLESAGSKTIPYFLEVIREGIRKVRDGKYKDDIQAEGLTIHVCVLKHGLSLQKDIPLSIIGDDSKLEEHLYVALEVSKGELRVHRPNGWKLNQRKCKPQEKP